MAEKISPVSEERKIIDPKDMLSYVYQSIVHGHHLVFIYPGYILGICPRNTVEVVPEGKIGILIRKFE